VPFCLLSLSGCTANQRTRHTIPIHISLTNYYICCLHTDQQLQILGKGPAQRRYVGPVAPRVLVRHSTSHRCSGVFMTLVSCIKHQSGDRNHSVTSAVDHTLEDMVSCQCWPAGVQSGPTYTVEHMLISTEQAPAR
jgi:hypothetical protein